MKTETIKTIRAPENYVSRRETEEFDTYPYRTEFGRDRDRVLYSKAFRRLKGKTQVFITTGADHLRTRLTHTLEVSQISRTISYNLRLNGILTEAIALSHDLGHTPFGHVGERTLNQIMNDCDSLAGFQHEMKSTDKGFKHNWQGLRVVCDLEKIYEKVGLNLTNFTLWGILNHSSQNWKECPNYNNELSNNCYIQRNPKQCSHDQPGFFDLGFYERYKDKYALPNGEPAWSFEGFVVAASDEIAQRHHDIEDALHLGIIDREEVIDELNKNFQDYYSGNTKNDLVNRKLLRKLREIDNDLDFLPYLSKFIINFYTNQLIEAARTNISEFISQFEIKGRNDYIKKYPSISMNNASNVINFSQDFLAKDKDLQAFLKNRILNSFQAQQMDGKGRFIIRRLFKAYITNPRQLHDSTILSVYRNLNWDLNRDQKNAKRLIGCFRKEIDSPTNKMDVEFQIALLRSICDNIAGMTDEFALTQYKILYG